MDNAMAVIFTAVLWLIAGSVVPIVSIQIEDALNDKVKIKPLWVHAVIGLCWPVTILIIVLGWPAMQENIRIVNRRFLEKLQRDGWQFDTRPNAPLNCAAIPYVSNKEEVNPQSSDQQ